MHPKLTWQTDTCTVLMLPCNRCHVCQLIDNIYGVDCLRQLYYTKWWCSNNAKVLTLLSGMLHQLISYKAQSIVWIKGKTSFLTKPSKHSRPTTCIYFIGSHTHGHIDSRDTHACYVFLSVGHTRIHVHRDRHMYRQTHMYKLTHVRTDWDTQAYRWSRKGFSRVMIILLDVIKVRSISITFQLRYNWRNT